MWHTIASWLLPFRHFGFRAPCAVLALSRRVCCARQRRVKLKGLGHGSRDFLFPEVVADEPWPYGLVGDEKSQFYARQLDGDFFADVKNSDLFLQALQEDAEEKQVDADDHLNSIDRKATEFLKGGSNRQRKIVDRESFIDSLTDAISRDGKLTLVLGGKSVGKTLVVSHVAEQVRQAPGGNRTTLLVNMRQMPADDFYEATLSVASKQTNVLDILTQLPLFGKRFRAGPQSRVWRFIQQLPFMATLLGAWRAGMAAAAAPLATSVQNALASLNDRAKAECLAQLVNDIKKKGNNTAIIIDEANLALPNDGNNVQSRDSQDCLGSDHRRNQGGLQSLCRPHQLRARLPLQVGQGRSQPGGHPEHYHRSGSAAGRHVQDAHRPLGHGAETGAPLRVHLRRFYSRSLHRSGQPDEQRRPVLSAGHYIRAWHRQLHGKGTLGAGCGLCFFGWLGRFAPKFILTCAG